jgi:hypothetical protein
MDLLKLLRLRKPKEESKPESETKQSQPTEIKESHSRDWDLILVELKQISNRLISLDTKFERHDEISVSYLVELLSKKNLIAKEKREEAEAVIKQALTEGKTKAETVKSLIEIGIPRSSAFRYAEAVKSQPERIENPSSENETNLTTENK